MVRPGMTIFNMRRLTTAVRASLVLGQLTLMIYMPVQAAVPVLHIMAICLNTTVMMVLLLNQLRLVQTAVSAYLAVSARPAQHTSIISITMPWLLITAIFMRSAAIITVQLHG